jgi:Histidine kinase-, DNA gyrase B-, and HSP90-like ATPase
MGETRVDLLHLLEDLRDAYPGSAEETILTEMVANALDSRATTVRILTDVPGAAFSLADDGEGMRRRELARYHDLATSGKIRGHGIGFAGVGIKLALLVSREVLTETRRGAKHVATSWALASRHRAPWRWVPPPGLLDQRGTAVRLALENPLSPLLDAGFIEEVLRRHFQPLLDPAFAAILGAHYAAGVRFFVDDRPLPPAGWEADERAPIAVRLARKRKPAAEGYLVRDRAPLPEDRRGLAVSTFGKIIRQGWDWLGITPGAGDRIGGLIEVPALAECLTLNKADFVRSGARGALYLAYRKAIQEAVGRQLTAWGDAPTEAGRGPRRSARPIERDLEAVLADLAGSFPLLESLVEHRLGGQRALPAARVGRDGVGLGGGTASGLAAAPPLSGGPAGLESASVESATPVSREPAPVEGSGVARVASEILRMEAGGSPSAPTRSGERRPRRSGLSIQFVERGEDLELGRLVESTVWVNTAHPAYRRAVASRSEGYHVALTAALALAPLAVEPAAEHAFVTAFLGSWGAALDRGARRSRRRQRARG